MSSLNVERNLELVRLIWLDRMGDANEENRRTQEKFRSKISFFHTFDQSASCVNFLRGDLLDRGERVVLVASGSLGAEIIEQIHSIDAIIAIFIFCMDKERNEVWAKHYSKIKGVFVELEDLLDALEIDYLAEEFQLTQPLDFLVHDDQIVRQLHQVDCSLVDRRDLLDFLHQLYQKNRAELENIDEFEHLYHPSKALDWFVNQTFLFRLLIRSLRHFHLELIYRLRFFLQDLAEQLKSSAVALPGQRLFRGQLFSASEMEAFNDLLGDQPFRWKGFFIASRDEKKIRDLLERSSGDNGNGDQQRVLFIVEPNDQAKEYRQRIFFPLQTEFRRLSIRLEKRLWIITLAATAPPAEETVKRDPLDFVHHVRNLGRYDDAEVLFNRLLSEYPRRESSCYDGLARLAEDRGDLQLSEQFFVKALDCASSTKDRSYALNNLACLYDTLGDYDRSLQFYSQALALINDGADRSMCLNNLAISLAKSGQCDQAVSCFKDCLALQKKSVGKKHFFVGIVYTNLAVLYTSIKQIDLSMKYYSKAFPLLGTEELKSLLYLNLAQTFEEKSDCSQALVFYRHAQTFFEQHRTNNHPSRLFIEQQIERLKQQGISLV